MQPKNLLRLAAATGFMAVALGAFGAHSLKPVLEQTGGLEWWKTGSTYHMIHAVAMLLPASMAGRKWPASLFFFAGIVLFSGSLYVMGLTGIRALGMVTPLGGLFFLAGWVRLFFTASANNSKSDDAAFSQPTI